MEEPAIDDPANVPCAHIGQRQRQDAQLGEKRDILKGQQAPVDGQLKVVGSVSFCH